MPRIQRILPPFHAAYGVAGTHMIGETAVHFDADGLAEVDDPAVLEAMQQFPAAFSVVAPVEAAREVPPSPAPAGAGQWSAEDLDMLTVAELQDLAQAAGLMGTRSLRKPELIEAILAAQRAAP